MTIRLQCYVLLKSMHRILEIQKMHWSAETYKATLMRLVGSGNGKFNCVTDLKENVNEKNTLLIKI